MSIPVLAAYLRLLAKCGEIQKMNNAWRRFASGVQFNDNLACQSILNTCADLGEAGLSLGREV